LQFPLDHACGQARLEEATVNLAGDLQRKRTARCHSAEEALLRYVSGKVMLAGAADAGEEPRDSGFR